MAEPILVYQGAGERHGKSEMLSGDHGYTAGFLWNDVRLSCEELSQAGSFLLQHLMKFYAKLVFKGPLHCSGLNGNGDWLFGCLEVDSEAYAGLDWKITDDLTATHPEIVDDPDPRGVTRKYRWKFDLIANVLSLFRHRSVLRRSLSQSCIGDETSSTMRSS